MDPKPPSNPRLLHAFACSVEDLAANRRGSLTPRQQQVLAQHIAIGRRSSRLAWLACLGSAIFLVSAPFLIGEGPAVQQALPYLAGTALLFLVIASVFIGIGLRRLRRLRHAQISTIEGAIRRTAKNIKHGRWTAYYACIGPVRFQLTTEQQYEALVEGRSYRIYYIDYPPTHLILSIEEAPSRR